ncbi:MAG: hypothetical protein HW403_763 [Dehalococcoidia bacterium]|nr:hypothetical protein [Dehalococcoidia bacterium]
MNVKRMVSIAVLVLGVVAALYYTSSDKEAQGAVILLLGILYYNALPHIS